jgi:NADP-dependent 3-hydroxy acid dehydrogenase YdfG
VAQTLSDEGARLVLVGRTASKLERTAQKLGDQPPLIVAADLTSDQAVTQLGERAGEIDIAVLAAGEYGRGPIRSTSVEELDRMYRSNLRSTYLLTQTLLPGLTRRRGQIVFVNSSSGLSAREDLGQFSAINHALKALADTLRSEVNPDGIRVISVYPGRTATPRQEALYRELGQVYRPELLLQPADIATVIVCALTLARTAEMTDVMVRPLRKSY